VEDSSIESGGFFEVAELALWEFSAVTFGANQHTGVIDVAKGQDRESLAIKLNEEIQAVCKSIINGKGTDERQYNLEMRLKYLNARMMDLALLTEPTVKSHSAETREQIGEIKGAFDWNKVANKF